MQEGAEDARSNDGTGRVASSLHATVSIVWKFRSRSVASHVSRSADRCPRLPSTGKALGLSLQLAR